MTKMTMMVRSSTLLFDVFFIAEALGLEYFWTCFATYTQHTLKKKAFNISCYYHLAFQYCCFRVALWRKSCLCFIPYYCCQHWYTLFIYHFSYLLSVHLKLEARVSCLCSNSFNNSCQLSVKTMRVTALLYHATFCIWKCNYWAAFVGEQHYVSFMVCSFCLHCLGVCWFAIMQILKWFF